MTVRGTTRKTAFTLIEVMVAVSILAVIMVLITQAISMISDTWRSGIARVDNFSQARAVLNLINRDIQGIVIRPDVAAFVDANGQSSFAFYSRVNGNQSSSKPRRLSLVQYFRNETTTPPLFQRKDAGFNFDTTSTLTMSLNQGNMLPTTTLSNTEAQTLAEGIIDFKWQALDGNADVKADFKYQETVPGDLTKTKAIIVSLLVVDSNAFRSTDASILGNLRDKFSGAPAPNQTYAQYWNGILNAQGFGSDLRPQLRRGIRCFERYIPLPIETSIK